MAILLKRFLLPLILTGVLGLFAVVPSIQQQISNYDADTLLKYRGARPVSDDIVFIFMDSRDIAELDGWPITRDYYGYLIYILKQAGARTIAIDVQLSTPNKRYPEYDADLSQFLRSAQNVCLPFMFSDMSDTFRGQNGSFFLGSEPQFPDEMFRNYTSCGFSNLASDEAMLRHAVLAASNGDSLFSSFGLECARQFLLGATSRIQYSANSIILSDDTSAIKINTENYYKVRLNPLDMDDIKSISLIDLFQTFQNDPEILDVRDKLVYVGVTAPGVSPMKVTPTHAAFPASLAHLTLAENIITGRFVRTSPLALTLLIIFIIAILVAQFLSFQPKILVTFGAGLLLYAISALFLFKLTAFALPLIFPAVAFILSTAIVLVMTYRQKESLQQLYTKEIEQKQHKLAQAQEQLAHLSSEAAQLRDDKEKEILRLENELRDLKTTPASPRPYQTDKFSGIIHAPNSAMIKVLELVDKISSDDIPVLICGETGTGKEVISRAIHDSGRRAKKQFIAVNCGALPETLLESELFGHEKGAFTGATSQRKGRFELADGGTLFLDEITETTAAFQAKLLRVLQEGTFERLGSERTLKVDVRIIAASSKNIQKQVEQELFREDLFYRLNGIQIELPSLRQRQDDIPLLALHFLQKHGYNKITAFSERALEVMKSYRWAGNVRELENTVRRAALLAQSENRQMIQEIDLPDAVRQNAREELQASFQSLDEQILATLRSLKFSHSSISQTAQTLGNKDRGTITEYFRGFCFEHVVKADFDVHAAAQTLAATDEDAVIEKVKSKISEYVGKVEANPSAKTLYKGLPKKYHEFLDTLIQHFE